MPYYHGAVYIFMGLVATRLINDFETTPFSSITHFT